MPVFEASLLLRQIPLLNRAGEVVGHTLLDVEDVERLAVFRWHLDPDGYAARGQVVAGRSERFLMHRVVLGLSKGDGLIVDHINRNKLDNRKENLRVCTQRENQQNLALFGARGKPKHRNVYFIRGKWRPSVTVNGRTIYLGVYDDEMAAVVAVQEWRSHAGL